MISVEAGFGYGSMLVDVSPGVPPVRELAPEDLGLSPGLVQRLAAWLERWDVWASVGVSTHLDEPEPDWVPAEGEWLARERESLAYAVQHELGTDVEVLLDGAPVHGRRGP